MFNFTQISSRHIGNIRFDAVTSEDHTSELSLTENPIESGAAIADHAVVQPKQITINGVMVDHDHSVLDFDLPYIGSIRGATDFLNKIPLPLPVVTQTAQTLARASRLMSQATYLKQQIGSAVEQARAIAPWLPDFGLGGMLDSASGDSRVQKCYADLVALQKSGQTVEIQTGIHLYQNMMLTSIAVSQAQDGTATFTITAREIFIVDTATVATDKNNRGSGKKAKKSTPEGKKKSGRAGKQSAKKSQKGNVQLSRASLPKTPSSGGDGGNDPRNSVLDRMFGK